MQRQGLVSPMAASATGTATKNKISVSLTDEAAQAVQELAERTGLGVSEIIRRAIALERFIITEVDQGSEFLIRRDGELERIKFIFA